MVVNLLKNGAASFFVRRQQTILSAAAIIMISVAASRILGLVRYRLLAHYFGENIQILDAFIAASLIPEAIFDVLIFGAISVAFIPVFTRYLAKNERKIAWDLSSSVISLGVVVFSLVAVLLIIFADFLPIVVSPGLVRENPEFSSLIANLIRVMIAAQIFFVISAFLTGILQSFQRFLLPALAAVLYNLGIIFGIVVLSPFLGIYGPAWGMVIGAFFHLVIQIPLAKSLGTQFKFGVNFHHPGLMRILRLMLPRSLSLAAIRANDIVNIALASLLIPGSIVAFNFAQVLYFVPIGLFGVAIAQAALPTLSLEFAQEKLTEFKNTFLTSFHQILFLVLPTSAILAILRIPVVRLVFGARQFPWESTVLTGRTLIIFSIGLAAAAVSLLLVRGFYAMHDTKTPVVINIFAVTINVSLSVLFIIFWHKNVMWLAGAYAFANLINAFTLLFFLDRKVGHFAFNRLFFPATKMSFAALLMAISLYIPMKLLDQLVFDTTRTVGLIALTSIASLSGIVVYLFLTWLLKVEEASLLLNLAKRLIRTKITIFRSGEMIDSTSRIP